MAAAALAAATPAAANGRFPASNQLVFAPSDPQLIVARTTFGILRSNDDGGTWSWLCEDALGLGPTSSEDPELGLTANDSLIVGLSLGLKVSPDTGCTWNTITSTGLQGQLVKDIVVRPDNPHTVLALTSTFEPQAGSDGGAGYVQGVFTSPDDGVTWTQTGTIDPDATVTTIDVAASDPQRIYVSAFRGQGATRTTSLFVSTNGGGAWNEYPTPFDPAHEAAVYIAGVDPKNADVVYLRSEGTSRLMVTNNGGKSFTVPFTMQDQMEGFALSPDGSTVYVGGPNVGLYTASAADLNTFTNVLEKLPDGGTRTIHVQCLAARGNELWACSDEPSGFIIGTSTNGGVTFADRLHLTTIAGPVSCPAGTTSAMCEVTDQDADPPYNPFGGLCANLGVCFDGGATYPLSEACVDAGVCDFPTGSSSGGSSGSGSSGGSDAGPGGDGGGSSSGGGGKSGCGCSAVGGGGAAGALAAAVVALLAVRRRRTR